MKEAGTILIVDDVPENLAVLFDVLSEAGYEVLVVESGEVALERIDLMRPDLVLLDVRLPGMDGYAVCRELKASEKTNGIPVIMITGLNETGDKVNGFEAGAVDYVCKPLAPEEVLARVRTHLELRRLRQRLQERNHDLMHEIRRRRKAERELEQSLDQAVMLVEADGKVQFATRRAWDLLQRFFPDGSMAGLPPPFLRWLEEGTEMETRFSAPAGDLLARRTPGIEKGGSLIRLQEQLKVPDRGELEALGLTPREAEVLYWMAQGKTSPEIALILESAVNTVKKHAQRIYTKLGVENRTAAALRASELRTTE
jgi:DNA-binding response OmpR family regulator/DNA-binding CsgD family transcriptional regulator